MNLRKLPPTMLLALGLACTTDDGDTGPDLDTGAGTTGTSGTSNTNGTVSATSTSGSSGAEVSTSACLDVGPCLFDVPPWETSTGPCLEPPADTGFTSSSGSDGSSGTDTGTGTDDGTTMGPCLAPPPMGAPDDPRVTQASAAAPPGVVARREALERLLARGTLPPDVAARLRDRR